jgi:hypothetical protein
VLTGTHAPDVRSERVPVHEMHLGQQPLQELPVASSAQRQDARRGPEAMHGGPETVAALPRAPLCLQLRQRCMHVLMQGVVQGLKRPGPDFVHMPSPHSTRQP